MQFGFPRQKSRVSGSSDVEWLFRDRQFFQESQNLLRQIFQVFDIPWWFSRKIFSSPTYLTSTDLKWRNNWQCRVLPGKLISLFFYEKFPFVCPVKFYQCGAALCCQISDKVFWLLAPATVRDHDLTGRANFSSLCLGVGAVTAPNMFPLVSPCPVEDFRIWPAPHFSNIGVLRQKLIFVYPDFLWFVFKCRSKHQFWIWRPESLSHSDVF